MNNPSQLPEDPSQWPNDPFKLIGVTRNVDKRQLRQAYSKLIRIYKPDHFPVEFQKIRDAYLAIKDFLQCEGPSGCLPYSVQENDNKNVRAETSENKNEQELAEIYSLTVSIISVD